MKNKAVLISTVAVSALVLTTGGYLMGRYASQHAITPSTSTTSTTINPSTNKQQSINNKPIPNSKAINLIQEFAMGKHLPNEIGLGVIPSTPNKGTIKKENGKTGKAPSITSSSSSANVNTTRTDNTGIVGSTGNGVEKSGSDTVSNTSKNGTSAGTTKGTIKTTSSGVVKQNTTTSSSVAKQNTTTSSSQPSSSSDSSSSSSQTSQTKPSVTPTPAPVVVAPPVKPESPALQSVLAGNDPIIRGGNLTIAGSTLTESQERSAIGAILSNAPEPSGVTGGGGSDFFAYVSTDGQVYYIGIGSQSVYYFINTTLYTNDIPADTFHVNNQFYQELSAIGVSSSNSYHMNQAFDSVW